MIAITAMLISNAVFAQTETNTRRAERQERRTERRAERQERRVGQQSEQAEQQSEQVEQHSEQVEQQSKQESNNTSTSNVTQQNSQPTSQQSTQETSQINQPEKTIKNEQKSYDALYDLKQETKKIAKETRNEYNSLSQEDKLIIWCIVLGLIFILITRYRYKRKCDSCKKWNAMRKTRKECVDEKPTVIIEERKMKNSKGEVIRTWEDSVPATIYYYRTHRKCKHCGYKDYLTSSETVKN